MLESLIRILRRRIVRTIMRPIHRDSARPHYVDASDGEPVLSEEALVHAKSEHIGLYIIHFYIAARDTVVDCEVPYELWQGLEMKSRGTLTHQGGKFYSFETKDDMYCGDHAHMFNPHP